VTAHLQDFLEFIGLHPNLAIAAAYIVSAGEALPVVGLFSPSTVVPNGIDGFFGLGKLSFWRLHRDNSLSRYRRLDFLLDRPHPQKTFGQDLALFPVIRDWRLRRVKRTAPIPIMPATPDTTGLMPGMNDRPRCSRHRDGQNGVVRPSAVPATAWAAIHFLPSFSAGLTLAGLNVIIDGLAVVVGILAIGIVLACGSRKGPSNRGCASVHELQG
jgi:hypothetical protein